MKYATEIMKNPLYQRLVGEIEELEADRIYCRHGMPHIMDVCRLAWILYLEESSGEKRPPDDMEQMKDRIFVTGLLHDIGRGCQYKTGEHHAAAGARLAGEILEQIHYPEEWKTETVSIIRAHCGRKGGAAASVETYINRADHLSRPCFCCKAAAGCKWPAGERNTRLW